MSFKYGITSNLWVYAVVYTVSLIQLYSFWMYVHLHKCAFTCMCVCVWAQSSSIPRWAVPHLPAPNPLSPSLHFHLLAILLLLLLELPEVALDGGGGLLHFNRAEWRNRRNCAHAAAGPVAAVGVWAWQGTGHSQRGRSKGHGDIFCSNDWVQAHGVDISFHNERAIFLYKVWVGFLDAWFDWGEKKPYGNIMTMIYCGRKIACITMNQRNYLLFLYTPMLFLLRPSNCGWKQNIRALEDTPNDAQKGRISCASEIPVRYDDYQCCRSYLRRCSHATSGTKSETCSR